MSRHIEFTTSPDNSHTKFSLGNPVHNGELPVRFLAVRGVRVDGTRIEFIDESFVDRLHRALIEGRKVQDRSAVFDCLTFVALMQNIKLCEPQGDGRFLFNERTEPLEIHTTDSSNLLPVNIGHAKGEEFDYVHSLYPAHTSEGAWYIQKLGDRGPVCLSSLDDSLRMYRSSIAHPMTMLEAKRNQKS